MRLLDSLSEFADSSAINKAVLYLAAVVIAEIATVAVNPVAGITLHILILTGMIVNSAFTDNENVRILLLSLTLVPLIRIISLSMPLSHVSYVWRYPIIYLPLLVAAFQVMRLLGLNREQVGLVVKKTAAQAAIALSGVFIGLIEYFILKQEAESTLIALKGNIILSMIFLLVCTGFVEELMFRGIIQYTSIKIFGRFGIVYVSLLFATVHLIHASLWDLIFVFLVAMYFSLMVRKTGSLLGVTLSHGMANIVLFLVAPLIF